MERNGEGSITFRWPHNIQKDKKPVPRTRLRGRKAGSRTLSCVRHGPKWVGRPARTSSQDQVASCHASLPGAPASPELPGPGELDARARVTAIREAIRKLLESIRAAATVIDISGHPSDRDDQLLRARELLMGDGAPSAEQ